MKFQKGHIPWNKDKHIQTNTGKTHFKKGVMPWSYGKKGYELVKVNKEQLYQLYVKEKLSTREVSQKMNVPKATVNKRLTFYGWKRTPEQAVLYRKIDYEKIAQKRRSFIDKDKLYQLYCVEGYSSKDLEKILNADYTTIQKRLKKYGWLRPSKEAHNQPKYIQKLRDANLGKKATPETIKKLSDSHKGIFAREKHPNWKDGKSFEPYGIEFNRILKEQIRKRDSYRCQECFRHQDELYGKSGRKYKLHVHHIDYNKKNNENSNLISLCRNCHLQTNFNREDWIKYYKERSLCL